MGRNRCGSQHPWPVGPGILKEGWSPTRVGERDLLSCPFHGWVLWWCPSPKSGLLTSCHILVTHSTEESTWHLDTPTLPVCTGKERIPWSQGSPHDLGLLRGVEGGNHHTGHGAPVVCHLVQSFSRHVLWSSARAPQVPDCSSRGRQFL